MSACPVLRLRLLGRFSVTRDGGDACLNLPTKKTGALLAYLAMSRDFAASREELAALLWGGCSDQQARQSLRQALALLRREIGVATALVADTRMVRLDPAHWSIDAREFVALARSSSADDLARAAQLLSGDFLTGLNIDEESFEEWVAEQRTRLQRAASQLCETFVKHPDLVRDKDLALVAVDQLTVLDPLREDWHRIAIALYARYRGKNEALARANHFAGLLMRELGVNPEPETRAMLDTIKGSDRTAIAPVTTRADSAVMAIMPPPIPGPPPALQTGATPAQPPLIPSLPEPHARRFTWRAAAALAAVLVAGVGFGSRALHSVTKPTSTQAQAVSTAPADAWPSPSIHPKAEHRNGIVPIVILPFTVLGATDDAVALTASMLTDDLTNLLSRVPSFRVISPQTARSYRDKAIDAAQLGEELHVRYVLEGSIRAEGDNRRINVALIDAASRITVWSGRIDRTGTDRQGVRDEIVGRLARELQFEVPPIESVRLSNDFDAGALAYKGWAALSQVSLDGYRQALDLFNQALERDPENLSALTGVGAYHARMGAQVLDTDPMGHRDQAVKILRDVLARDPNSSAANSYLGLALNKLPTLPEAMKHLQRAVDINPSDASAYAQIGNAQIRSGKPAEGLENVRYAMQLSPRDPIMPVWLEFAGNAELELNHYDEAISYFRHSIALNSGYPRSWAGLVAAEALAGQSQDARDALGRLRTFAPSLNDEGLIKQFGRHDGSRLYDGLRLALGPTISLRN
jgi:DNA-binding SARP family transcriptional activator/TolB-like protein/Flp pilus assembly protein TadD